ncbi:MAG: hypothetical protein SFW62_01110 [Alphaproteobacteria bacterium]|nr:hypothetical protein [Alphaproteobacteria bacterium]
MKNLSPTQKNILAILIIVVVAFLAYSVLTMPDNRNTAEKIGDAIHELPQGVDKAARQLEDRTPGQQLGDTIKDAGDEVKENTQAR